MEQSRRGAVADRGGGGLNRVVIAVIAIVVVSRPQRIAAHQLGLQVRSRGWHQREA